MAAFQRARTILGDTIPNSAHPLMSQQNGVHHGTRECGEGRLHSLHPCDYLEWRRFTMAENKLVCVIGATGNQGGSVARRFCKAGFRVRGLTRDPSSASAQKLAAEGIEAVSADLNDVESLKLALKDANVVFSVTNYWEPFFRPDCRQRAREQGISPARFAYNVEYQQGKNIADAAAATCDSLDDNGFLVSTLSHAAKCSGGKFTELYHFDAKADIFPYYVKEQYPKLAAKMSCIQTGYFYTSFNILPNSYFGKVSRPSKPGGR